MDLLDPGIKQGSPALQVDSLPSEPLGKPGSDTREAPSGSDRGEWIEIIKACEWWKLELKSEKEIRASEHIKKKLEFHLFLSITIKVV